MFNPPFCPYKACLFHAFPPKERWWRKEGFHETRCFGHVPRFRCRSCGRTFSTQTFSLDFYAKRQIDYRSLEGLESSSISVRALARHLSCSCGSVLNRIDRLARQSLACHSRLRPLARRHESVCIDGFVSFDRSQFFPNNITISITHGSRYVLDYSHASIRRSGSMRPEQKIRREKLYRGLDFEKGAIVRSFTELLDELSRDRKPLRHRPLVIITDEKLEYLRAFHAHPLFRNQDENSRVVHLRVNSRLPRTFVNPLFPSNYLDREIRKDQAGHRRETTCFNRNSANGMMRFACYVGWHNYRKRYLVKGHRDKNESHGEMAGIGKREIKEGREKMFGLRAFLSLEKLDRVEERIWRKEIPTLGLQGPSYVPRFALA